ncbi:hypothetical protein RUM44_009519 [Polyplax serrata]|uniref:BED-type domain-containing protein n=1 Tax=Polyplax serrata TaxID=468196 RepID=A0ABR1ASY2_POLSC
MDSSAIKQLKKKYDSAGLNCGGWLTQNSRNPLWKYFLRGDDDNTKLQCVCCKKYLKYVPGYSNPSNLVRHLRLHGDTYNLYMKEKLETNSAVRRLENAFHLKWSSFV